MQPLYALGMKCGAARSLEQEVTVADHYCQSGNVREGRERSTHRQGGKHIQFSLVPGMNPSTRLRGAAGLQGCFGAALGPRLARAPFQQPPH